MDNIDLDFNDPFRSPSPPAPAKEAAGDNTKKRKADGLGIDEEVDVTKKPRAPRVKLDEARLLSDDGIPKLRKRAAGLKLKGKGHEVRALRRRTPFHDVPIPFFPPKGPYV